MTRRAWHVLITVGLVLACTEDPTAPGRCPDYCPPGQITMVDTLLETAIVRDSAFRGYLTPQEAPFLLAANIPGVRESRPIMDFQPLGTTVRLTGDTTTYFITATDSALLTVSIARRDTLAGNLRVMVYKLPTGLDSNTTYGNLAGAFADSLLKSVNVDSLVADSTHTDSITGDRVVLDSTLVRVIIRLDSTQARFVAADSGHLAMGIRVQADTATSAVFGANESSVAALIDWYFEVDSAGTPAHTFRTVAPQFDSYVFDPPAAALDSTLAVGGMPSARSLLRFELPARIADSTQIVRAVLALVPSTTTVGAPIDSFTVIAQAVLTDLGAKSPMLTASSSTDSTYFGSAPVPVASSDTVFVNVTRIMRRWAADTAPVKTMVLRSASEGVVLTEARFHSSRNTALRPTLRVTYVPRFPFGVP